jgi:hypothetical protein
MDSEKRPEGRPTRMSTADGTTAFLAAAPFVTATGELSITTLIRVEAHIKQALRLLELDVDPDARREAKILDLAAARIRARRWAA